MILNRTLLKNGEIIWDSVIGDPRPGNQDVWAYEVWPTTDAGFILIGQTDNIGENYHDLIKADSSGNVQWWKRWLDSANTHIYCGKQALDGGYVVSGTYGDWSSRKVYLEKFDQNGNSQWSKTFADGYMGLWILVTKDGSFVIFCFKSQVSG